MTRSLAVEGTVFWIVTASIFNLVGVPYLYEGPDPSLILVTAVLASAIFLVLGFMCFRGKSWAFLTAFVFALVLAFTDVAVSRLVYPGDQLIAVLQLLIAFFSYSGYRELKTA